MTAASTRWIWRAEKWCGSTTRAPRSPRHLPSQMEESSSALLKAGCCVLPELNGNRRAVNLDALDVFQKRLELAERHARADLALQRLQRRLVREHFDDVHVEQRDARAVDVFSVGLDDLSGDLEPDIDLEALEQALEHVHHDRVGEVGHALRLSGHLGFFSGTIHEV